MKKKHYIKILFTLTYCSIFLFGFFYIAQAEDPIACPAKGVYLPQEGRYPGDGLIQYFAAQKNYDCLLQLPFKDVKLPDGTIISKSSLDGSGEALFFSDPKKPNVRLEMYPDGEIREVNINGSTAFGGPIAAPSSPVVGDAFGPNKTDPIKLLDKINSPAPAQKSFFEPGSLQYHPLAPIPGIQYATGKYGSVELGPYLASMFKLGIGLCSVFAVLMIMIGGLEYVLTEKAGSKEDAKTRISGAIVGLLLALSSYIILYTINPCLISLDFTRGAYEQGCQSGSYSPPPANSTQSLTGGFLRPSDGLLPSGSTWQYSDQGKYWYPQDSSKEPGQPVGVLKP